MARLEGYTRKDKKSEACVPSYSSLVSQKRTRPTMVIPKFVPISLKGDEHISLAEPAHAANGATRRG
jgi:hypothetical protein